MKHNNITKEQKDGLGLYIKLMRATNRLTGKIHRHLREDNLTVSQFGVLEALYHLGPLSQGDLVEKILKSNANLTTVVDSLEKKKLVRRMKSERDGRRVNVELTAKGSRLICVVFPRHAEIVEKTLAFLTDEEKNQLTEIMRKFKQL